jgi:hypothetical protein
MKLRWLLLVLLAFATLAQAFDTYRVGSRLIRVGDSVSELIDLLGEPIYKEQVTTRFGGYVADKWQYRLDGKAVQFTISGGRIQRIEEIRDEP